MASRRPLTSTTGIPWTHVRCAGERWALSINVTLLPKRRVWVGKTHAGRAARGTTFGGSELCKHLQQSDAISSVVSLVSHRVGQLSKQIDSQPSFASIGEVDGEIGWRRRHGVESAAIIDDLHGQHLVCDGHGDQDHVLQIAVITILNAVGQDLFNSEIGEVCDVGGRLPVCKPCLSRFDRGCNVFTAVANFNAEVFGHVGLHSAWIFRDYKWVWASA